ncbi:ABC transporter permease subunit [Alphaproteobacteria bacterium KMM 3653]|uniref:ABC transporter permease subunit n=1 Tax=Harenicola maris TaxID=2841044 RepID=A0AAP2G9M8_9RHOB|nr:ABC transporter permease subunit [Harenicola maris]
MSCAQTISDYALRSLGYGERLLPRADITFCEQVVLIGSGMIWNIYFGVLALAVGFFLAVALGLGKASPRPWPRRIASTIVFIFRGSPLFIQFFFAYFLFLSLRQLNITLPFHGAAEFRWLTDAWAGALIVLILNTSAYGGEIFYGALRSIPKGDVEAAEAYGITGWNQFFRIKWPTMLRLAWPGYTNEAIFLFHATTLVFFSAFPVRGQRGDALYYASYFADKTFNPFIPYPIIAVYFIMLTLCVIGLFGLINRRLNRHMPQAPARLRIRPQVIR